MIYLSHDLKTYKDLSKETKCEFQMWKFTSMTMKATNVNHVANHFNKIVFNKESFQDTLKVHLCVFKKTFTI